MARYHAVLGTRHVPDSLLRAIIRRRLRDKLEQLEQDQGSADDAAALRSYAAALAAGPFAIHQDAANRQHYELPTTFFQEFLGPRLKYSCCLWPDGVDDLAAAEEAMLALTCERAGLEDGMRVLDLGCGCGDRSRSSSPSGSRAAGSPPCPTRARRASTSRRPAPARGLDGVTHVTADIAGYDPGRRFDRILSVEMYEHVRDYRTLFARLRDWLEPDGRAFMHVFSHSRFAYTFDADDPRDWMGSRFFSGGQMPAHDLFLQFDEHLVAEERWWVEGEHYARTLNEWLRRYDAHAAAHQADARRDLRRGRRGLVGRLAAGFPRLRRDVRVWRRAGMGRLTLPFRTAVSGTTPRAAR